MRDGGCDDPGESPVDRYEPHPDPFSLGFVQGWKFEDIAHDSGVEDFDSDVAIQQGRDEGGDERNGIAKRLEAVCGVGDTCTGGLVD